MKMIKDCLVSIPFIFLFLLAVFVLDDSYEDSKLSAQVLDEAIAQAYAESHRTDQLVSIYEDKAIQH